MGSLQDLLDWNWGIFHFHDGRVYWKWRNRRSLHYCDILPRCTVIDQLDHRDHTLFLFFSRLQIGTQGRGILKRFASTRESWEKMRIEYQKFGPVWWGELLLFVGDDDDYDDGDDDDDDDYGRWWSLQTIRSLISIHPFTSRIANGKWWWKNGFSFCGSIKFPISLSRC